MNTEHPAMAARMHATRHAANRILGKQKTPFRFSAELSIEDRGTYKPPVRTIVEIIKNRNFEKPDLSPLSKNSENF
jgi:hypothetical protein